MTDSDDSQELLHASVRPGDVLAGKYSVEKIIGSGGMGVVVAAVHVDLYERVALKFLLPEAMQSAEVVARFGREARAAFKLKSEHVGRVMDIGTLESGVPYIVMEYLEGTDLDGVLSERGPLSVGDAVEYILQACEALSEAHMMGIVHRDLKPANLFLTRRRDGTPCIKVLDFGLSKVGMAVEPKRKGAGLTGTRQMLGSPLYMPPEQMSASRDADVRSDIWALGVILFELLTNSPPFVGDTLPELQGKVLGGMPEKLTALRPDVPAGLEAVVMKCLQKDRTNRYANVAEFAAAVVPYGPMRCRVSAARIARMVEASGQMVVNRPPAAFADEEEAKGPAALAPVGKGDDVVGEIKALPGKVKGVMVGAVAGALLLGALVSGIAVGSCGGDEGRDGAGSVRPKK